MIKLFPVHPANCACNFPPLRLFATPKNNLTKSPPSPPNPSTPPPPPPNQDSTRHHHCNPLEVLELPQVPQLDAVSRGRGQVVPVLAEAQGRHLMTSSSGQRAGKRVEVGSATQVLRGGSRLQRGICPLGRVGRGRLRSRQQSRASRACNKERVPAPGAVPRASPARRGPRTAPRSSAPAAPRCARPCRRRP
jgi:hypothetical protein